MKAISLLQPWASLVVMGVKQWETRSWSTAYRGELLIHASKGKKGAALSQDPPFSTYIPDFSTLPFGSIIGQVLLMDVIRVEAFLATPALMESMTLEERAFGNYEKGRWCWILGNPLIFRKPIPVNGALSLWEYSGPLPV